MKTSRLQKLVCFVLVALLTLPAQNVAFAANSQSSTSQKEMVSASAVLNEIYVSPRADVEKEIRDFLSNDDVKAQLQAKGVSAEEMTSRLASLSDQELQTMSKQVHEARAGGDILVTVLLIVLIIYFIKRI